MSGIAARIAIGAGPLARHGSFTELAAWKFVGDLAQVFRGISIGSLEKPERIVTVNSDMLLPEAVEVLSTAGILCAPVIDVDCTAEEPTWRERYCGVFDLSDVVMFVVGMTKKKGSSATSLTDFRHAMAHKALFHSTRVKDVAHRLNDRDPFLAVDEATASLLDAIHFLGRGHYHRLFVTSESSADIANIITQSHIVKILAQHAKETREMTEVVDKTIEELGLVGARPLITVNLKDEAYTAFSVMKDAKISAVPVVDDTGNIVGNISTRDIRVLVDSPAVYKQIHSPLHHFIAEVKGSVVDSASDGDEAEEDRGAVPSHLAEVGDDRASAITCKVDTTLRVVLRLLHVTKIHRVYVVRETSDKPVAVVTLTDILSCMAPDVPVGTTAALTRMSSKGSRSSSAGSPTLMGIAGGGAGGGAGGSTSLLK